MPSELQPVRSHCEVGDLASYATVFDRRLITDVHVLRELDQIFDPRAAAETTSDRRSLVHERRNRNAPSVAFRAESIGVGRAGVREEHFVETTRTAHLLDRPNFNTRSFHVDDEVRKARVLDRVLVGAGNDHAPLAELCAGGPDFLAIDHPVVTVTNRRGLKTGEVRTGIGLGKELTPHLVALHHVGQEAIFLFLGSVGHDGWAEHPVADPVDRRGHVIATFRLIEDHRFHRSRLLATELFGPAQTCPAGFLLGELPRLSLCDGIALGFVEQAAPRVVGVSRCCVCVQPCVGLGAIRCFFG